MKQICLDQDWLFHAGGKERNYLGKKQGPDSRIPVDLPHDCTIHMDSHPDFYSGSRTGYYPGAYAVYEKYLQIPTQWKGQRLLLRFDGVYGHTTVEIEGNTLAQHPYGYTPFVVDITDSVHYGETTRLQVSANNLAEPNSRFYTGTGIYRHVDLLLAPMTHIAPDGIFAYLKHLKNGTAFVMVETTVENHTGQDKDLLVQCAILPAGENRPGGKNENLVHVPAGSQAVCRVLVEVPNARLWDIDDPFLYTVEAQLTEQDSPLDQAQTSFGIRTLSLDRVNGFQLNGRTVKLKGGCVHHDNGILGAASFRDSEYRKMKLHKDAGFNAIRCAHNPPSRDMLDACDRLGLLVMDEAFDMWNMAKSYNDYHLYFDAWWKKDMEAFIKRDRNHPCVAFWSTGNEIGERAGNSDGYRLAGELADYARQLDPTRFITNAINSLLTDGLTDAEKARNAIAFQNPDNLINEKYTTYADSFWGERTAPFAAVLDVVGYNYLNYRYEKDGAAFPGRLICGTESFPMHIDQIWEQVEALPFVIGDFTWTSYDYLGEAGIGKAVYCTREEKEETYSRNYVSYESPYPWRVSNCSDFDLCGFERPQLAYRQIVWGASSTYLAVRNPAYYGKEEVISFWGWPEVENRWDWPGFEGKPISVDVYSPAEEVELFLDGKSLGKKHAGKKNRFIASFETVYRPGELKAVSYREGKILSEDVIRTAGVPCAIQVKADRQALKADGQSLVHLEIQLVDENGLPTCAALPAKAHVDGAGSLLALGSGDPKATYCYTSGEAPTYRGKLLAVLRAGREPGMLTFSLSIPSVGEYRAQFPVE